MLAPIYDLITKWSYLALNEDQINISYKAYKTDNQRDMQEIISHRLAPGEKFQGLSF